jgi:SAM-dependent methyltransferase
LVRWIIGRHLPFLLRSLCLPLRGCDSFQSASDYASHVVARDIGDFDDMGWNERGSEPARAMSAQRPHVERLTAGYDGLDVPWARERGLENIAPTQGDARELPYPDDTFDAAYLVTVLGEIPDQEAALRQLARVLKPGGRLVVGELLGDPHWVSPAKLRTRAEAAGLRFERRAGSPLGYFARFAQG